MTSILIGLTRFPRVFLLGAIALKFGISEEADTFLLIYSVSLFLIATISYTSEVLAPGIKSFILGCITSTIILIGLFLYTDSLLALISIVLVILSSIASTNTGIINRQRNYTLLAISVVPYFVGLPFVFLIPSNIYLLTYILVIVEVVRCFLTWKYFTKTLRTTYSPEWSFTLTTLSAVVIGASTTIIVKLFASQMSPGTVSILAYTFGAILPISNALSYGASVDKVNRINVSISLLPSILATCIVILVSFAILFTPFWIKDLSIPVMIFACFIPLSVASSIQRAYFSRANDKSVLLKGSIVAVALTIVGSTFSYSFDVYGFIVTILVVQAVYLGYLTLKLRQQNHFSYNEYKAAIQEGD